LLAASASLDVARGAERWMGFEIKQHGPTILLDFELDLQEQARRVYQLAEGLGLDKPPDRFYYLSGADYPPGAVLDRTLQLAKEMGAVLVILDSLGFALEGNMEAASDVLRFIRNHVLPFKAAGVTLLIVDHQAKPQSGEGYHQKSPFGSVYKSNACRSVTQVGVEDQREGELTVRFRHQKCNFGSKFDPFEAQLLFHATRVEIRHRALSAEETATEGSLNTKQKIRRLLKEGPMFPEELDEKIDAKLGTIKNKLTELRRDDGEVEYTGVESDTGARQVRLIQTPSSSSLPNNDGDGDDGPQDGHRPGVLTHTPTGTTPLPTDGWEVV
jgi:AAA domain